MSSDIENIEQSAETNGGLNPEDKVNNQNLTLKYVGQRLQIFINHLGISNNKFAQAMGLSGSMISHMINGNNFGVDKMVKILNEYPTINIEWLLTGKGSMIREENKELEISHSTAKNYILIEMENKFLKEQLKGKDNELQTQAALTNALHEIIALLKK